MQKQNKSPRKDKDDSAEKVSLQKEVSDTPTTDVKDTAKPPEKAPTSTKPKKKLVIKSAPYSMFKIGYEGGGETPDDLKGLYTSQVNAQKQLDSYLKKRDNA